MSVEQCKRSFCTLILHTMADLFIYFHSSPLASLHLNMYQLDHHVQAINAGSSSKLAADNMTGCLPDVWQFCEPFPTGFDTNLFCPSVAYRRPTEIATSTLTQVCSFGPQDCCFLTCVPFVHLYGLGR